MFDLEQSLRHWRQEIEATLAFANEEIDELEDHLRFSFAAKMKEGLAPETAWSRSLGGLGSASALALEFAKDKLMPALWRLLTAWWRPVLLLSLFGLTFVFCVQQGWQQSTPGYRFDPWVSEPKLWGMAWVCLVATLRFLPDKTQRNAVLAGVGNAFCLIPLLHVLFYNALTEKMVGSGWSHMAASFGWPSISLSLIGLVVLNLWWWKRNGVSEKFPAQMAMAGTLILVLTLSPFVGELIGNLSIREVYQLPTASQVALTGEVRDDFLKWKFVDVLINSVIYIANILPFGLVLLICMGVCGIHFCARNRSPKVTSDKEVFPSSATLPWLMTLIGSGLWWVWSHLEEPPVSENIRQANKGAAHAIRYYGGLEIMVLLSALLFFVCGWELTKKLARASRLRPFYAAMPVVIELGIALALPLFPALLEMSPINPPPSRSAQPEWLSWGLGSALVGLAGYQSYLMAKKLRSQAGQISLWKFDGENLVELGLILGLIFAGCGLILYMVATVMAFESVSVIQAMIAWGESIQKPAINHFYPQRYGTPDHLAFWVASGISYLSLCLAAGLGAVIVLSALEFVRFNSFRLYKLRKARRGLAVNLALNE